MAGDVNVAVVSGQVSTSGTGTADFTKAGFGTPKVCIILIGRDDTDDTSTKTQSRLSIGFSDFTNDFCVTHQIRDNVATEDSDARKSNATSYTTLTPGGAVAVRGTASAITDGVRLTNSSNNETDDSFATVIMFNGADLAVNLHETAVASAEDGTVTITHSGFTDGNDKLIFFIGTDLTANDNSDPGVNNSFGVCHATGSDAGGWTFVQRCIGWASDHANTVGAPHTILSTDRVLDIVTEAGGQDWGLEVTALDHSPAEWTITSRDAAPGGSLEVYSLALDLGDRSATVFSVDSPTTGSTFSITGMGFKPQYVGLGLTRLTAEDVIDSGGGSAIGSEGISSNAGSGEETCHGWYNEQNAATINTNCLFRSRVIDLRDNAVANVKQDHSHSSFDSGGVTHTINSEDETAGLKWMGWAIEEAVVADAPEEDAGLFVGGQQQPVIEPINIVPY